MLEEEEVVLAWEAVRKAVGFMHVSIVHVFFNSVYSNN